MSPPKVRPKESKKQKQSKGKAGPGRRFTDEQKSYALSLVLSGMTQSEAARAVGTTETSIRHWMRKAKAEGKMPSPPIAASTTESTKQSPGEVGSETSVEERETKSKKLKGEEKSQSIYAPKDPGQGLSSAEQAAILELKKRHPSYGPAQIRTQLKRFKGWRVSIKAIARWLKQNGYELVHRGSRPQGYQEHRFEAPRRNGIWQTTVPANVTCPARHPGFPAVVIVSM